MKYYRYWTELLSSYGIYSNSFGYIPAESLFPSFLSLSLSLSFFSLSRSHSLSLLKSSNDPPHPETSSESNKAEERNRLVPAVVAEDQGLVLEQVQGHLGWKQGTPINDAVNINWELIQSDQEVFLKP